ncbi:MAG: SDR family NAD(P)-dependent oxidoreductase [Paenibacillaceae bacterium]|nr:SDR family NAD(P)-dependent oxidoreductase [Paenibacillaceae bacterium]
MNKVWLVTGSGRGLGRSIAEAILDHGDRLVATARNTASLTTLQEKYGDRVKLVELDVTDQTAADASVQLAVETFGRLDVLVNNAGFSHVAPFEQVTQERFKSIVDTNFYGVVNLTRAALPVMRQQRSGHIINITSIAARTASPGQAAYNAAKFAASGFTESVAGEVAPFGVKMISVEPGGMRTECSELAMSQTPDLIADYEPSVGFMLKMLESYNGHEIGDPAKIAKVIVDLSRREELPAHLVIGSDALYGLEMGLKSQAETTAEWEAVSRSTDFEGSDLSKLAGLQL